mmetsp:Transcript_65178/g.194318  ORF Transcript_65178/g.194318 Transcript_65178/m.194318 type:complete len:236 (-) Transcript_65178:128-835(-)
MMTTFSIEMLGSCLHGCLQQNVSHRRDRAGASGGLSSKSDGAGAAGAAGATCVSKAAGLSPPFFELTKLVSSELSEGCGGVVAGGVELAGSAIVRGAFIRRKGLGCCFGGSEATDMPGRSRAVPLPAAVPWLRSCMLMSSSSVSGRTSDREIATTSAHSRGLLPLHAAEQTWTVQCLPATTSPSDLHWRRTQASKLASRSDCWWPLRSICPTIMSSASCALIGAARSFSLAGSSS